MGSQDQQNGADNFKEIVNDEVLVGLNVHVSKISFKEGDFRSDRIILRLREGAGKLQGVFGIALMFYPALKALLAASQVGNLALSNQRVHVGPHRIPN